MNTGTLGTEGHEPVSSLALKAEKQEAEGGDRSGLLGRGPQGSHGKAWLGTQVRAPSPQSHLPKDVLQINESPALHLHAAV